MILSRRKCNERNAIVDLNRTVVDGIPRLSNLSESKLTTHNQSAIKVNWANIIRRIFFFVWHTIDWHVNPFNSPYLAIEKGGKKEKRRTDGSAQTTWRAKIPSGKTLNATTCSRFHPLWKWMENFANSSRMALFPYCSVKLAFSSTAQKQEDYLFILFEKALVWWKNHSGWD